MPATVVKRILKNIKPENRKIINELLDYPEDSAGSIMTVEYVDLKENLTVQEALDRIKKIGLKKETIYNCYVTNMQRKLLGAIELKDLVIAERTDIIKNIMDTNIKKITTITDKEEVAKMFDKYHLLALPVVDKEDRLVGIITVDDAIDVMQDEVSEDFEKMAAMQPNEDNYFKTSVFKHSKNRIIWLLFLMLTSIITGTIITNYENAFATVPILVAFIPMLMDTGGNCGSQSSTLVIRGLAMDEIRTRDFIKVWWKEFRVSLIVGITLAVVNGIRILIQYRDYQLSLVVGLTLIFTVSIAKSLGCILPILAKKLKMDPAIMASPLITTIVDTCSVLVFFNVAVLIMKI
jgi:magnesium transporter